jgi:L-asparaginase / beta-aspartyl-peptidase
VAPVAEPAIVVHGGAGPGPRDAAQAERWRRGCVAAVAAGHAVLAAGGEALDAVQVAVRVLEDDPSYNAGRGAALNADGQAELDAAIMRGRDRAAGAVAALRGIRNPVDAARAVLDEGRHVLLAGPPATAFALRAGVAPAPEAWFVTERQREALARRAQAAHGTVGAVARDTRGGLAAATSTGGISGQRPGRVGDSPLVAAGTWADDATAAVSCTGDGEAIIRAAVAHEVDARIRHSGAALDDACADALAGIAAYGGTGGLIAVGAGGDVAAPFTTPGMARAWRVGEEPVRVAIGPGEDG